MAKNYNVHEIRQTKRELRRYEEGKNSLNWVYENPALFATIAGINMVAAKAKRERTVYPASNAEAKVVYDGIEKFMKDRGANRWEISQVKRGLPYGDMIDLFTHLATRGAISGATVNKETITVTEKTTTTKTTTKKTEPIIRPDGKPITIKGNPHKKKIDWG